MSDDPQIPNAGRQALTLIAPNADPASIIAGIAAAQAIFADYGTTASEAALAAWRRDLDDTNGCFVSQQELDAGHVPPPQTATARDMQIANAWWDAGAAALRACYGDGPAPTEAQLVLRPV